jgi:hypothetical protein
MSTVVDVEGAGRFLGSVGRVLDRRRFEALVAGDGGGGGGGSGSAAELLVGALDGYANADGGYGWGLEPDLRDGRSQPGAALHAFEVFEEALPFAAPRAVELCGWLAGVSLADGGLPFALPVGDATGTAPFWAEADSGTSSLHITAAVAAAAHRVARGHPGVAGHPWLAAATRYCLTAIEAIDGTGPALELRYALDFLDAVAMHDRANEPAALAHIERLGKAIPPSGQLHVAGGLDDEMMRPLDFAPWPDRPVRELFAADVVVADLRRVASLQQDDGGWPLEWRSFSPAAELEWRGYLTVRAVQLLRANRML